MTFRPISLLAAASVAQIAFGQNVLERSVETRFQIDLQVSDAALKSYLPPGWSTNVAPQGPAKDCNLRAVFIDRMTITGPDGKPMGKGSNRLVYLVAPVKNAEGASVQLVIGGLSEDASDAPGPFGNYLLAKTASIEISTSSKAGTRAESQDWRFEAASGEHLEFQIDFTPGPVSRSNPAEVKFYSAKDPSRYQISKQEQSLDILKNATTNPPDRVKKYTFKGAGGSYSKLFDGTEKLLSWDHIVWIDRTISTP